MSVEEKIDQQIAELGDWRGTRLAWFRQLVHEVEPETVEDFKWGVGVFTYNKKLICAMSAFNQHTKFNFFSGAFLDDQDSLFNSGLDSKKHRSINLAEHDKISEKVLGVLLRKAFDHERKQ
jgi:hypothetical protein